MKTITDKAILIRLSIGMPGNIRKDKELTGKVQVEHNLTANAGRWVKQMYPDNALKPLITIQGAARMFHLAQTLPWSDEGSRILPTANIFTYGAKMREFKTAFAGAVDKFCADYPTYVEWAKVAHNGTFRAEDYPGAEYVRGKFYFETQESPIPEGKDFRVEMQREELKEMATRLNQRVTDAVNAAKQDLGQRLAKPIQHLSTMLKTYGEDKRLHKSLITNLNEVIELIPVLNITGDKVLERVAKEAQKALGGVDVEELRNNEERRKEVAARADEITAKLAGYFV